MDPIILSAIKKAKKELEEKHQVSAQTLDDLKSALTDLKDTKLPRWVQDILDKVDQSTDSTGTTLSQLKSSLEEKLSPWTATRAGKLDRLDTTVSSRADGKDWTAERAGKVDKLDVTVSSRLSKDDFSLEMSDTRTLIGTRLSTEDFNVKMVDFGSQVESGFSSTQDPVRMLLPPSTYDAFTSPGSYTWTCPEKVGRVIVEVGGASGGGGGSGGGSNYDNIKPYYNTYSCPGGAGGRGAYLVLDLQVIPGASYTVVVGGGGSGGSGGAKNMNTSTDLQQGKTGYSGKAGGNSSFDKYIAGGGTGGSGGGGAQSAMYKGYVKPLFAAGGKAGTIPTGYDSKVQKTTIEANKGKDSQVTLDSEGKSSASNIFKGKSEALFVSDQKMQGGSGGDSVFPNNYPYADDGKSGSSGTNGFVIIRYTV